VAEDASVQGLRKSRDASQPVHLKSVNLTELARRLGVVLGSGVPLVGTQEELRGPNGYTPRGFISRPRQEAK